MNQAQPQDMKADVANPFRPGNGVAPPFLAGRDRMLAEFEAFVHERPLHANWAVTGLRGTGKTVLVHEFATRAERAGWLTLERELSDRHRDDERFADAVDEDVDALVRRVDLVSGIGQKIEDGWRYLRPRRVSIGDVGVEPSYAGGGSSGTPGCTPKTRRLQVDAEPDRLQERHLMGRSKPRPPGLSRLGAGGARRAHCARMARLSAAARKHRRKDWSQ